MKRLGIEKSAIQALEQVYAKLAYKRVRDCNLTVSINGTLHVFTSNHLKLLMRIRETLDEIRENARKKSKCDKCIRSALGENLVQNLQALAKICISSFPSREVKCRKCWLVEEKAARLLNEDFAEYAKLMTSEENLVRAFLNALKPYIIESPHACVLKHSKLVRSYEIWPFKISLLEGDIFTAYMSTLCVAQEIWLLIDAVTLKTLEREEEGGVDGYHLREILESRKEKALEILRELYKHGFKLPENWQKLGELVAFRSCGLDELYPPLLDESVEEINILSFGKTTWIHHSELGGCIYNRRTYDAAQHLTSLVKLETGIPLDEERPYIKATIQTHDFKARVSIDIPPIAVDGLTISIRKFRVKPFTLAELIARGTLTAKAAAYLLWNLYHRRNISIVGESGAGKTTLAVALDALSPPWRKISIEEEAVENISQRDFGIEHVRYLTLASKRREREAVLLNILHKSPVYVFLGEVLYPEDSRMLFHMLASGIKCIHTCHAEDVPQLLSKWKNYHGIPVESLLDLDLLVVMKKSLGKPVCRRVVKICEIEKRLYGGMVEIVEVFVFNPNTQELEWRLAGIDKAPSIRRAIAEGYSLSTILEELASYERALERYALLKEHSMEALRRELLEVRERVLSKKIEVGAQATF